VVHWRKTSSGQSGARRQARSLVQETESFLCGRVRDRYVEQGLSVPPWAELNWLAHAEPSDVRARAAQQPGQETKGTWSWATGILARELVSNAGGKQDAMLELQRQCLIPMELTLMGQGGNGFLPKHLVALGVPRLRSHPGMRSPSDRPGDHGSWERGVRPRERGVGEGGRESNWPSGNHPLRPL
jgi:hypothetical protein